MISNLERRIEKLEQTHDGEPAGGILFLVGTDEAELEARSAANPNPGGLTYFVIRSTAPQEERQVVADRFAAARARKIDDTPNSPGN